MELITCKNVSLGYDTGIVVSNLDFTVNSGDYLCIVGENGSGKSTLIKGLLHLKKTIQGEILLKGGLKSIEIGYLPQQSASQRDFPASVYEVVLSGRQNKKGFRPFYNKEDKQAVRESMEKTGILDLEKKCYRELSGGQQQRTLLARALCSADRLLLLDEPAQGLDPLASQEMYQLIHILNKEKAMTIIMVSHDMQSAVQYADHILHLGKTEVFFGTLQDYMHTELAVKFTGIGGNRDV